MEGTSIESYKDKDFYPDCSDNEIPDYAFYKQEEYSLTSLRKIILPKKLKTIGMSAFQGCINMESIDFPQILISYKNYSFCGSYKLVDMAISSEITAFCGFPFCKCDNLFLDPTHNEDLKIIRRNAFANCQFAFLSLPEGVIRVENSAFMNCDKLEKIIIPKSLQDIERYAFGGCINLKEIINYSEDPQSIDFDVFEYVNIEKCILRVPLGREEEYQNHEVWKMFKNIELMIN